MKGIFDIAGTLSTESANVNAPQDDVTSDIESANALNEVGELRVDIENMVVTTEQSVLAAETVMDLTHNMENQLASETTPSEVTSRVSHEELMATVKMINGMNAYNKKYIVSHESHNDNPLSAMTVTVEGAKDFLKKILDAIKGVFNKIKNNAKKIFVRVVTAMDNTEAKAKKLQKLFKDVKDKYEAGQKFSKKDSLKLQTLTGIRDVIGRQSGTIVDDYTNSVINDLEKTLTNALNTLENLPDDAGDEKKEEAKKAAKDAQKALDGEKANYFNGIKTEELSSAELDKFGYTEPDHKSGTLKVKKLFINGMKVKVIETYIEDKEDDAKEVIKFRTLTLNKDELDEDKEIEVLKPDDLERKLSVLVGAGKYVSKVKDTAMKFIENQDKAIDKLAKKEQGSYFVNKIIAGEATLIRDSVVNVALDSVLYYAGQTSKYLTVINMHVNEYKGSSM